MDFESPDVEKDFPGLYASESGKKSNESDFSDGEQHEKPSKKDLLIGRRKDKKDSKKDKGYAALEGDSSPEEELETKSPSKSKKTKSFIFPTKSKDKREKSRDKDKVVEKDTKEKDVKEDREKKREKDKKDKDKKEKIKDKRDKKLKHGPSEESLDLGDAQPIFGVSLGLAVVRSRCHDETNLPQVVRDCIDFLEEYGLTSDALYKVEGLKTKVQHLRKLYNNREVVNLQEFDVATAYSLLKMFLRELPEPILTTDLSARFEEASAIQQVSQRESNLLELIEQLPSYNCILLSWLVIHFDHVTRHEKLNKMNAQSLAMLLSPVLQMSHRLLVALLCHCKSLFPNVTLDKYIPPLTASAPSLPDSVHGISKELRKQESLLSQIHSEMNAGFVSKKREEQLWEVQRIITQLKRKLRTVEKKTDNSQKSVDDERVTTDSEFQMDLSLQRSECPSEDNSALTTPQKAQQDANVINPESPSVSNKESTPQDDRVSIESAKISESDRVDGVERSEGSETEAETQSEIKQRDDDSNNSTMKTASDSKPNYTREELMYLEMQYENAELLQFVSSLQARINAERSEVVKLRTQLAALPPKPKPEISVGDIDIDQAIGDLLEENHMLEQKRNALIREIFDEKRACIDLRVQLAMMEIVQ